MCISVPSHLFLLGNSTMYISSTIANSQGIPTELNKNGSIAKVRSLVEKVIV